MNAPTTSAFIAAILSVFLVNCTRTPRGPMHEVTNWQLQFNTSGEWLDVQVPGDVITDLLSHGLIPDPYQGTNERLLQWIEDENWTYRTFIPVPRNLRETKCRLRFTGLDTFASIYIDDTLHRETRNAHQHHLVELAPSDTGWNVMVRLDSPVMKGMLEMEKQPRLIPVSNEPKPIGQQTSSVTRKPGYQFGWDWGPRLVSCGISGAVFLEAVDQPLRSDLAIETDIREDGTALVRWSHQADWPHGIWELIAPDGACLARHVGKGMASYEVPVKQPELWWPHGMGEQPLYSLKWTPSTAHYTPMSWRFGLRELRWEREEDKWGRSFRCAVNGVPVQARGANVIPADFFPHRGDEKQRQILQAAIEANMNMLRVWGGAVYPDDAFLDFCDSTGLLVWQDFMFACSMVPGDSAFLNSIAEEAEQQVRRIRHHPSLALWCGNNESQKAWRTWGWQDLYNIHGADSIATEAAYQEVFHELLPKIVAKHDNAAYWPSSPMPDPMQHANASGNSGDEHAWHVWFDTLDFSHYSEQLGRFSSEYGLQSLPNLETLKDVGITAFEDESLQFRQRSKMEWLVPGLDGWGMMRIYARRYAADPSDGDSLHSTLERWIYLSQLTQSIGLQEALERHRTSQGKYSGSLYWQLNDVWPAVSWSTVDHAGRWKLGHYAVQKANQPRCVLHAANQPGWALSAFNDCPTPLESTVLNTAIISMDGDTMNAYSFAINLSSFRDTVLNIVPLNRMDTLPRSIVRWEWLDDNGDILDQGDRLTAMPSQFEWPTCTISCEVIGDQVRLTSDAVAFATRLSSSLGLHFKENGFTLFPGETKTVQFDGAPLNQDILHTLRIEHFGDFQ